MAKYNKSKIKIMNSFANLLENHNLCNITVSLIIQNSKTTKGTFYNNFKNISDVIIFMNHYIDDECFDNLKLLKGKNPEEILNKFGDTILPLIYKKRELIKIMFHSNLNGEWNYFLEKRYVDWATNNLFCNYKSNNNSLTKDIACKFFIHNFLYLLKMWITQPIPKKPEDAKILFLELLNTSPIELLQKIK